MAIVNGRSDDNTTAAVQGEHIGNGTGVEGATSAGTGVVGRSKAGVGVWGTSAASSGVAGVSTSGIGVHGVSQSGAGVRGDCGGKFQAGVVGVNTNDTSEAGPGVFGTGPGAGVWGESKTWHGVYGESSSTTGGAGVTGQAKDIGAGVLGRSDRGVGVWGGSKSSNGVGGMSETAVGVHGVSTIGTGVWGSSETGEGIRGATNSPVLAAIVAHNTNALGTGAALFASKEGAQGHAGFFQGQVFISKSLHVAQDIVLENADCAEEFSVLPGKHVEAGDVVVLCGAGELRPCDQPSDTRVAGVVSGAGHYRPAMILDRRPDAAGRVPVALFGKVFCKVDADHGRIQVGDLLTTSSTIGHAMVVGPGTASSAALVGKALGSLDSGQALIPILIVTR